MSDPFRSSSLPRLNKSDNNTTTLMNPAYSGSVTDGDSSSGAERVDIESAGNGIKSIRPVETKSMKRIKYCIIILFLLIGLLTLINISHFANWISERSSSEGEKYETVSDFEVILDIASLYVPGNETEEISTTEIPTTSTTTTSTTESTTTSTEPPTTIPSFREHMRETYQNFTEKFNRTFSEEGLDNYLANMKFFWISSFGETQFADLSEKHLRKLVIPSRDKMREETSKRCDIHSYSGDQRVEGRINGSVLYEKKDRIPSRVDLRRRGIIGAVKNQGTTCNGGYAFAVTNLLESKVNTNGSRLSVQMLLIDDYNHHCEGGETFRAMESAQDSGIVTESVLPFDESQHWQDIDGNTTRYSYEQACLIIRSHKPLERYQDPNNRWNTITIQAVNVSAVVYIKHFLAKVGSLLVEVPVNRSFFFYKSGAYSPNCSEGSILGYQPALLIGYGMRNGVDVWILRNSFGTEWGMDGDFEMDMDSECSKIDYAFTFYKAI